jgi:PAS domain S-box-containing protein
MLRLVYSGATEIIGRQIDDLHAEIRLADTDLSRARGVAFVNELLETGRVAPQRFDLGPHPSTIPVEVSAFRIEADEGGILLICIVNRLSVNVPLDPAPAAIDADSRLAYLMDATPDGVVVVDRFGFVTSANTAAGRLLGQASDELVNRPLAHFVAAQERAQDIAEQIASNGSIESEEVEIVRADGKPAWLSISARTLESTLSDDSDRTQTIVFIRDVTKRFESHSCLERNNEELEDCVRSLSHDLRSPLASLLGFTHLLRADFQTALGTTGLHFLHRIEESGRNMERLLRDLLDLSRIRAVPEQRVRTNPRAVLMQLRSEFKQRLDEKGIELSIPDRPPLIVCDGTRLYQLFSNLIGNAISHMEPQTPAGRIEVEIESVEDGWQITVADNGPGIALEDQERVFEAFQTAGPTLPGNKSGGLGLAIVKKIVESHRGRVWVENRSDGGARFVVHLPDA